MTEYFVEIDHFLGAEELECLKQKHLPNLTTLNRRYTPNIDVENQFPVTPIYIDFLRTQWRFDTETDRPERAAAISALGFAFGRLLDCCTSLRWCMAKDSDGLFLSKGRQGDKAK